MDDLYKKFLNPENREYYKFIYKYRKYIIPQLSKLEESKDYALEQISIIDENGRKINQVQRKIELLKIKHERIFRYLILGILGAIVSSLMMYFGFYYWYTKVQIYLDEKLKAEVNGINK